MDVLGDSVLLLKRSRDLGIFESTRAECECELETDGECTTDKRGRGVFPPDILLRYSCIAEYLTPTIDFF